MAALGAMLAESHHGSMSSRLTAQTCGFDDRARFAESRVGHLKLRYRCTPGRLRSSLQGVPPDPYVTPEGIGS